MHGTTMMFLFAVPVMQAAGLYLVPLMIGARNVAFPKLNAYGYWVYLFGGVFLYVMFFLNTGPDTGWFSYVPLVGTRVRAGQAGGRLGAVDHVHRDRGAGGGGRADRHHLQEPGARDDPEPDAALRLGDAGPVVHGAVRHALGGDGQPVPRDGPAGGDPLLQPGRGRRRRCCGSTCSGSSAIPRSTSSSCPRWASCRPSWPRSPGDPSSAIRPWSCRWSPRRSWASGSGSTTCSRPACPSSARASSPPRA